MSSNSNSKLGTLKIKVQHWLMQVRIFDNAYNLIQFVNEFERLNSNNGLYEKEITLDAGIYEIEVALANKVNRTLIKVKAGQTTEFESEKNILDSVSADYGVENSGIDSKADPNISWNLHKSHSIGDSNLCLHIHVPQHKLSESNLNYGEVFNIKRIEDITLPYSTSAPISVINFKDDLLTSVEKGEIFINKDLPSGFYIAEWLSTGNNKSYQPLYLHRGFSTRVFISTHVPVFNSFYISMADIGVDFSRDSEEEMAAQTIIGTFNHELRHSLVLKDKMKFLLSRECKKSLVGCASGIFAYSRSHKKKLNPTTYKVRAC